MSKEKVDELKLSLSPKSTIVGFRLVTGIDFIGVKTKTKAKKTSTYDRCIQIFVFHSEKTQELRFIPLNNYDRQSHDLPFRTLTVQKDLILYEYLPDKEILDSYLNLIVNQSQLTQH